MAEATFGSGCFWCTEAIFKRLNGVTSVKSGYSGGHKVNPSYKEVCDGTTGHAEVIRVNYDEENVSYEDLLEVFWKTHDPTTLNRQGNDVGTQYRSVIFYHNDTQQELARKYLSKLENEKIWSDPIVTEISPLINYYEAENYHDDYYDRNGSQPYCSFVITPKVKKFKKIFADKLSS